MSLVKVDIVTKFKYEYLYARGDEDGRSVVAVLVLGVLEPEKKPPGPR